MKIEFDVTEETRFDKNEKLFSLKEGNIEVFIKGNEKPHRQVMYLEKDGVFAVARLVEIRECDEIPKVFWTLYDFYKRYKNGKGKSWYSFCSPEYAAERKCEV